MTTPYQPNPAALAQLSTMFSGIQQARAKMDANYERTGHYLERIDRVRVDISRKQETFIAIEKTIVFVMDDDDGKGHKKGEQITHMLMQKHDMFLPNVKAFIAASLSMEANQITEAEGMAVCGVDQPLTGTVLECQNKMIQTKAGHPFTAITYRRDVPASELLQSLPPNDQETFFPGGALQRLAQHQAQYITQS